MSYDQYTFKRNFTFGSCVLSNLISFQSMYLCVTQIISGGANMLPLIYSPRFDRYTYINMPYAIMIHQSSFLLTLQGYRNALRQVLGCDKSLNSPLQRGYEF